MNHTRSNKSYQKNKKAINEKCGIYNAKKKEKPLPRNFRKRQKYIYKCHDIIIFKTRTIF